MAPAFAAAQDRSVPTFSDTQGAFVSNDAFAEALSAALKIGDFETALSVLQSRPDIAGVSATVRLRAELLVRLGRPQEALNLLEAHLARDHHDAIARFQVGEIHFLAERDSSAVLSYRLALAGQLDGARRELTEVRLGALDARRRTRFSFSFSVAPDSNLNGATSASTIDLYGLPFILSDDARRRSGVAASFGLGVERRQPVTDRYALVAGGSLALLDAPARTFDQTQVGVFFGTEARLADHSRIGLTATFRDVDFGGDDLETSFGGQLSGLVYSNPRTRWDGSIGVERIESQASADFDGLAHRVRIARTRFLGPNALWRASAAFDTSQLRGPENSFSQTQFAAGRLFPLPFAGLAYVEPYGRLRIFDVPSTIFGVRRRDQEVGVSVRVSRRDWSFRNAFPYIQAVAAYSDSNVVLGRYSRQRIEFGLTRDF